MTAVLILNDTKYSHIITDGERVKVAIARDKCAELAEMHTKRCLKVVLSTSDIGFLIY